MRRELHRTVAVLSGLFSLCLNSVPASAQIVRFEPCSQCSVGCPSKCRIEREPEPRERPSRPERPSAGPESKESKAIKSYRESYRRGYELYDRGRYREAEKYFRDAIAYLPGQGDVYKWLGATLLQEGRHLEALEAYRTAIRLHPYYDEELRGFLPSLEAYVINADGIVLANRGEWSGAESRFREALRFAPVEPAFHNNLVWTLFRQERYDEAVTTCRDAFRLTGSSEVKQSLVSLLRIRGLDFSISQQLVEAERYFREALQLDPNDSLAREGLKRNLSYQYDAARRASDLSEQIESLRKISDLDPNDLGNHRRLGDALIRSGAVAGGSAAFYEAIRRQPNEYSNYSELGTSLREAHAYSAAAEAYKTALRLVPPNNAGEKAALHGLLGLTLHRLGGGRAALAELEEAIRLDPNWPTPRKLLGVLLYEQGHVAAAHEQINEYLRFQPGDEGAQELMQKIEYEQRPREYTPSGTGLVGGTAWIFGYFVPGDPEGEKLRAKADQMLRHQMRLAGVAEADFIDQQEYNFILGVGASHSVVDDLIRRVLREEWQEGQFTAENQALYASLRSRQFERLDCHSNGAMVCLAALELGDAKTRHIRLFGPQITPESIRHWQRLIEQGKVGSVELYINKGDPIPGASYLGGGGVTVKFWSPEALQSEIKEKAPGVFVRVLDCPGRRETVDIDVCHNLVTYKKNLAGP